ncbi:MAG: LysR family transcriptional regulator [Fretibacterium sp.]|nr:LysR family transcriptional regulator [Fretibacterium sp.]
MSLYAYQVFKTIYQQGSFVRAAEVLGLTPSAVSHIISELEKEVRVSLFVRGRKGVALTGDGEALLPYIMDLLSSHERLKQQTAHLHGLENGIVRIGTYGSVALQWLPEIASTFQKKHPNVSFYIYQGGTEDILDKFRDSHIDIAFLSIAACSGKMPRGMESESLYLDPMLCVAPRNFHPRNGQYVTIEEIQDYPFILQRAEFDPGVKALFERYHLAVSSKFSITDDQYVAAMVSAGLGIAILPELVVKGCTGTFSSYPLQPAQYRSIDLAVRSESRKSPLIKLMLSHIRTTVKERFPITDASTIL